MAINIKNEETHRLVSRLAERMGTSLTEAVAIAVREKLERTESPESRRAALAALTQDTAPRMAAASMDRSLYGNDGLPA